jgi:hypothetical protein
MKNYILFIFTMISMQNYPLVLGHAAEKEGNIDIIYNIRHQLNSYSDRELANIISFIASEIVGDDEEIAILKKMKNLKAFQYGSADGAILTEKIKELIISFPHLESLDLRVNGFESEGFEFMKRIKHLEYLAVSGSAMRGFVFNQKFAEYINILQPKRLFLVGGFAPDTLSDIIRKNKRLSDFQILGASISKEVGHLKFLEDVAINHIQSFKYSCDSFTQVDQKIAASLFADSVKNRSLTFKFSRGEKNMADSLEIFRDIAR